MQIHVITNRMAGIQLHDHWIVYDTAWGWKIDSSRSMSCLCSLLLVAISFSHFVLPVEFSYHQLSIQFQDHKTFSTEDWSLSQCVFMLQCVLLMCTSALVTMLLSDGTDSSTAHDFLNESSNTIFWIAHSMYTCTSVHIFLSHQITSVHVQTWFCAGLYLIHNVCVFWGILT